MNDELYNLHRRVSSGAVSLDHALQQARSFPQYHDFGQDGIHSLAVSAIEAARGGKTDTICTLWRIVLEALDHAQTPSQKEAARHAVKAWIDIAKLVLFVTADGGILADARRRGEQLATVLLSEGDRAAAGRMLFTVGAMILDPYIERRDSGNFLCEAALWIRQGRDRAFYLALPQVKMPHPAEALSDAAALLERSAGLRTGRDKGRALKALAEAHFWHGAATGSFQKERIETLMHEALMLLDPAQDANLREQLNDYARILGLRQPSPRRVASAEEIEPLVERQVAEDPRGYLHSLTMRATAALDQDEAIGHLMRALRFAGEIDDEEARIQLTGSLGRCAWRKHNLDSLVAAQAGLRGRVHSLFRWLARKTSSNDEKWISARDVVLAKATADAWASRDLALAILAIAMHTGSEGREDVGLQLISEALGMDLSQATEAELILVTGQALLAVDFGATHVAARQWEAAVCRYLQAIQSSVRAQMPALVLQTFRRAQDAFQHVQHTGEHVVIRAMATSLPSLQSEVASESRAIADLWRLSIRDAAFVLVKLDGLHRALQGAKGASLGIARKGYELRPVLAAPRVRRALENWRIHSARTPTGSRPRTERAQEWLLVAHDDTPSAGAKPSEELDNLARVFDRVLMSELARGVPDAGTLILEADEMKERLPDKTVLVSQFLCPTSEWSLGFVTMLATRKEVRILRSSTHEPVLRAAAINGAFLDDLAPLVTSLRQGLLSSGGSETPDEVDELLVSLFEYVFGGVQEELADLHRQGYRHLCVNPHGALHFCPIGLLVNAGRLLVDDWIVTHLPALGMLRWQSSKVACSPQRQGASVFGVGFQNGLHGLKPIPGATEEAGRVAEALHAKLFLDKEATAEQFNQALAANRFVHVATHGSQDAAAPAFQTLFLYPDKAHDGQYRAFETLQNPLGGLDLVSLSACETALGRIDANDNLRGLQAFLFTAGVATILSCLWPVRDSVAAFFFESFYSKVAHQESKLEAFAEAQRCTRERYPAYQDWAAFQYSGAW
jgi:hypothetical protein